MSAISGSDGPWPPDGAGLNAGATRSHETPFDPGFRELQRQLLKHAERVRFDAGEIIFRWGEMGDAFFVVGRGRVRISVPTQLGEHVIADLGAGEYFGEMALLTGESRSATAVTVVPTLLHKITREAFWQLLTTTPSLALEITRYLSLRLRARTLWNVRKPIRVVVLLASGPAHDESAFCLHFVQTLADMNDSAIALIDAGEPRFALSLNEAKISLKPQVQLLDVADAGVADRLPDDALVVVRVHASYGTTATWLAEADALVMLDFPEAPCAPLTQACADHCRILRCEIQPERPAPFCDTHTLNVPLSRLACEAGSFVATDLRRFVRKVLGRQVGLALSAGGAKGLAHLGAVHVLEQAGIEFDAIAGTSMGGIMGGMLAMGRDCRSLLTQFESIAKNFRRLLLDFGLPHVSLFRGDKKRSLIEVHAGDTLIEQLNVPFATIAADLVSGRETVFASGPLALALDATSAIPMIFPPVHAHNRAYVDGWVVNPLPTDVLRRLGADIVLAVDTSIQSQVPAEQYGHAHMTGRRFGLWRSNPAIATIAIRALEVSARERSLASLATVDARITPNVDVFSPTDFRPMEKIVECGARAAEEALPAIRSALRR